MTTVTVRASRPYEVTIGRGLLGHCGLAGRRTVEGSVRRCRL